MSEQKTCFIIMPLTTPKEMIDNESYRDGADHFIHVLDCLFVPAVEEAGYRPIKPIAEGADVIQAEIIKNLETADLVLCDMSCHNPNVFFELGIRTSLNRPVCMVKDNFTEKTPFDLTPVNYHVYESALNPWELNKDKHKLKKHIEKSGERSGMENTLWKHFRFEVAAQPHSGKIGEGDKIDYLIERVRYLDDKIATNIDRHNVEYDDTNLSDVGLAGLQETGLIKKTLRSVMPVPYMILDVDKDKVVVRANGSMSNTKIRQAIRKIKENVGLELVFEK